MWGIEFDRADLAGYTRQVVMELVGERALAAIERDITVPASLTLADSDAPAALLTRFLWLGEAITERELQLALPSLQSRENLIVDEVKPGESVAVSDEETWEDGLIRYRAPFQIVPVVFEAGEPGWIASDWGALQGRQLGENYVMGVGGATRTLASATHFEANISVLDLGTGSGYHAIRAAKAGAHVVATDLSECACDFARFNAWLNDVDIDVRQGSLFDPVTGERFDLICSNPPFVITPTTVRDRLGTMTYRDGGTGGDMLVAEVVRGLADHLNPGGRAVMLANWEISGEAWWERPESWLGALDSLLIQREVVTPEVYIETWIRDGGLRPGSLEYADTYHDWLEDFAARGVAYIGFGIVMAGSAELSRELTHGHVELRGASPSSTWEYLDVLWENRVISSAPVLPREAKLQIHDVAEHRFYTPGAEDPWLIKFTQTGSYGEEVVATSELAGFVSVCDGELTVGQIFAALAQVVDLSEEEVVARVEPGVLSMLRLGMLQSVNNG